MRRPGGGNVSGDKEVRSNEHATRPLDMFFVRALFLPLRPYFGLSTAEWAEATTFRGGECLLRENVGRLCGYGQC